MKKNKNTLDLIASSYEAYNKYIDNPTSKNLKKFNLIGLCEECHDKLHNGELDIDLTEAKLTTNGITHM